MKLSLKDTPAFQSDITFDRKRIKNVEIKKPTEETKKGKKYITPPTQPPAPARLSIPPLPKREGIRQRERSSFLGYSTLLPKR